MSKQVKIDAISSVQEYLDQSDWRVKANANQGYSLGGLILNVAGKVVANYWLSEVYTEEIGQAHRNADYHIHDLDVFGGYCAGWSLKQLLIEGFNGIPNRVESNPPKHLSSAIGQMVNFLGTLQNEWAGAQAFSSVDLLLAPFIKIDNLSYDVVKQNMQELIYNLNVPSRWGSQAPFTNFTFDWTCPEDLKYENPIIGGVEQDFTYGELQKEMDMINRAYIEVMTEGDASGRVFTFPIPTYNITPDFEWDSPNADLLFTMTAKYGLPYFQNFLNSDMKPGDVRSMCPLTGDTKVFVRSSSGIRVAPIKEIVNNAFMKETNYQVWTPEGWASAKPVKVDMTDVYEITLSNGEVVKMGENHLQPVRNMGVMSAKDLKEGMWLPYNKTPISAGLEELGTEDLGFVMGLYAGDGSNYEGILTYSLNKDTDVENAARCIRVWNALGYKAYVAATEGKLLTVKVNGGAAALVQRFITGTHAVNKNISSNVFDMNQEFKKGFIDGYKASDGSCEKNRLYTSSKEMAESLLTLFASVGVKARLGNIDSREGRLSDKEVYRVDYTSRARYGDFFDSDDEFNYFQITKVENIGRPKGTNLYCFEVDNDEHLFMIASGLITHNCRLQLDLRELLKRGNGLFGSGEQTGSIGVVTVNMSRLGYVHKGDKHALYERLDYLMDLAKDSLEKKREVVQHYMDNGLFPYTKRYLGSLDSHFSTIGVNGINEMIRNFTNDTEDITTVDGKDFAIEVLDHIRARMVEFQEETGHLYNLEATPAEGTTYRFAKEDIAKFPEIIHAGTEEEPYYTNSSQLPVAHTEDAFAALEHQDVLQKKYTGGTVLHLYLGEKVSSAEACKNLVKRSLSTFHLPYLTVTPTFSICKNHGYITGEVWVCEKCNEACEVWTRVMGYHRPMSSFNIGKKGEFHERVYFSEKKTAV